MIAGDDSDVMEVSVMTAIQVAIFRFAGAENHGRLTASMMGFPLTAPRVGAAVAIGELFPTTFTFSTGLFKGPLLLVRTKFVVVGHDFSLRRKSLHQSSVVEFPDGRVSEQAHQDAVINPVV